MAQTAAAEAQKAAMDMQVGGKCDRGRVGESVRESVTFS